MKNASEGHPAAGDIPGAGEGYGQEQLVRESLSVLLKSSDLSRGVQLASRGVMAAIKGHGSSLTAITQPDGFVLFVFSRASETDM